MSYSVGTEWNKVIIVIIIIIIIIIIIDQIWHNCKQVKSKNGSSFE